MGLDVYVGTLTRYYAGAWETIVQQSMREAGLEAAVLRPTVTAEAVRDPLELQPAIEAWRDGLNDGLRADLPTPLAWVEGMTAPYFTDKPAWDAYSALVLWAAHDEQGEAELPPVAPEDWSTDSAVRRSQAKGFVSRYNQLLHGPELWLPGDFGFTFRTTDAAGEPVTVGAAGTLLAQLHDLNRRTWNANAAALSEAREQGAAFGGPLEHSARFALAVFIELAQAAVQHQLPMKLDY